MSQETRIARTRVELQKFLDEIAYLSRSDMPVGEYLPRFLQLTLTAIGGATGAVWMVQGAEFQRACAAKFTASPYEADEQQQRSIQNALRDAAQNRRPVVVGPTEAGAANEDAGPEVIINHTGAPFFFVPIIVTELSGTPVVFAVLEVWAPAQVDPKAYREVVAFLQEATKHAAIFLRTRRIESLAASAEKLQQLLQVTMDLNGQMDLEALAISVVNWGRDIVGCDRCVLFGRRSDGTLRVLAVSGVEVVDPKSSLVRCQQELAGDSLTAKQPTLYRKTAAKTEALGDISDYFFHSHANEAFGIPLVGRDGKEVGVLLFEAHKDRQLDENMRRFAVAIAGQAGRSLGAAEAVAALPFIASLRGWQQAVERLKAPSGKWLAIKVAGAVAVAVVLALVPWRFTVRGDCTMLPERRAEAITELGGRVSQVLVQEGDRVVAGQPVARLDDADVRQTLAVAEQEKAKEEAEADRQQMLGDDGQRRIALIQAAQVQREIDQLQRKLAKAQITSPIDGWVLTRDLSSRVGEMLALGGRFCEVGDLRRWEVLFQVGEPDMALLNDRLRSVHPLPVTVLLESMSDRPLTAMIKDAQSISPASVVMGHANVFVVRAELAAGPELSRILKAGYTGRGKVELGWRPGIYLATRRFMNYLRIRWLF